LPRQETQIEQRDTQIGKEQQHAMQTEQEQRQDTQTVPEEDAYKVVPVNLFN